MPDLRSQLGNELASASQQRGLPALGLVAYVEVCPSLPDLCLPGQRQGAQLHKLWNADAAQA